MSKNGPRSRRRVTAHVATTDLTTEGRAPSMLVASPKYRKKAEETAAAPLVIPAEVKLIWQGLMSVKDIMLLRIDTTYQREEITKEVNELVRVLLAGGQIPDPVTIAQRPDGTRYIVDGQQRWWAHVDVGKPMHARVFACPKYEHEVTLFQVLNTNRRVSASKRIQSWPKATGAALHWLAEDAASPLVGKIQLGRPNPAHPFPVLTIVRGFTAAATGARTSGAMERVVDAFDKAHEKRAAWTTRAVREYARIVAEVFDGSTRVRHLMAIALGLVCYARWEGRTVHEEWPMPDPMSVRRLRKKNWEKVAPGVQGTYLPMFVNAIEAAWPHGATPSAMVVGQ